METENKYLHICNLHDKVGTVLSVDYKSILVFSNPVSMSFTLLLPLLRPIIQATFQGEVQSLFGNLPWLYLVRNANIIFLFWQENLKGVIKAFEGKHIKGDK